MARGGITHVLAKGRGGGGGGSAPQMTGILAVLVSVSAHVPGFRPQFGCHAW